MTLLWGLCGGIRQHSGSNWLPLAGRSVALCLLAYLSSAPPAQFPVHYLSHLLLRRFRHQCLPLATCAMYYGVSFSSSPSLVHRRRLSAVVCRRWPSPPSFPRIYRLIAPDRTGNDAGAGRRVCCHAVVPAADAARRLCRCRPRQIATLVPIIEKIITFVLSF